MTYNVQSFADDTLQRHYDNETDRLFLVYYALPPGFNANKWGVSQSSIDANIHTAINKPVVVYRRNPKNPYHTHQAGNFVHPTTEEAQAELGHPPNAEEYYNWQEKFAIGRVRSVDKRERGICLYTGDYRYRCKEYPQIRQLQKRYTWMDEPTDYI